MDRQGVQAFIDTNMLIYATNFKLANVFEWIDQLYGNVWIHEDVLSELLLKDEQVRNEIKKETGIFFYQVV